MKKKKFNLGSILKYVFLSFVSFISIFPFIWMILGMTNSAVDITAGKIKVGAQLIRNFETLFSANYNFAQTLINSAVIAIITTVLALLFSSSAGYGF